MSLITPCLHCGRYRKEVSFDKALEILETFKERPDKEEFIELLKNSEHILYCGYCGQLSTLGQPDITFISEDNIIELKKKPEEDETIQDNEYSWENIVTTDDFIQANFYYGLRRGILLITSILKESKEFSKCRNGNTREHVSKTLERFIENSESLHFLFCGGVDHKEERTEHFPDLFNMDELIEAMGLEKVEKI